MRIIAGCLNLIYEFLLFLKLIYQNENVIDKNTDNKSANLFEATISFL
jgi:hypothetical protein